MALGDLAWSWGDRAAAENAYRDAQARGDRSRAARLAIAAAERGGDPLSVLHGVPDTPEKTVLLAAIWHQKGNHGMANRVLEKQRSRDASTPPSEESLAYARDVLRALAASNELAALYWAHWLQIQESSPPQAVKAAFARAAAFGNRTAAEWRAYFEDDPGHRRALLLQLEPQDRTGWATYELASDSFACGDRTAGLRRLDSAAKLGLTG